MKTIVSATTFCAVFLGASVMLFAIGPNFNPNQSAEAIKSVSRGASTEVDATFFNPAGTAFMQDGLYFYLSDQFLYFPLVIKPFGGYANELMGLSRNEYYGDITVYSFVNLYLVYKKDRLAWSFGLLPIGGGGFNHYNSGLQLFDVAFNFSNTNPNSVLGRVLNNLYTSAGLPAGVHGGPIVSHFTAFSVVYAAQTSVAYDVIKDKLSLSLGVRFLYEITTADAALHSLGGTFGGYLPVATDFHADQRGMAFGLIAGVSAKPLKELTIGITGDWNSPARLKTESTNYAAFAMLDKSNIDGFKKHEQMAGNLGIGAAYLIQGFQIAANYVYIFNQFTQMNGRERNYIGGYNIGAGIDYTFKAVPINIGCGYLWTATGARPSALDQIHDDINFHAVGCGVSYLFTEKMKLTLAFAYTHYIPTDINHGTLLRVAPAKYYRKGYDGAIGFTYKAI